MTKLFISYSHADEVYKKKLELHLAMLQRSGFVSSWDDRKITPGEEWEKKISQNLLDSELILLLVSANFLASSYCYDIEVKKAIELHEQKKAVVVPIIVRYCDWKETDFARLQCLPTDAKPIASNKWENEDAAFLNVVEGLKKVISEIGSRREKEVSFPFKNKIEFDLGGFKYYVEPYIATNNTFVGIDFGTSTTVISLIEFESGQLRVTPIQVDFKLPNLGIQHSHLLPSAIFYDKSIESLSFGFEAKNRKYERETVEGVNYWTSFKIQLGKDEGNIYNKSFLDGKATIQKIQNPKEATTIFFKHLKRIIDKHVQKHRLNPNLKFCISIPASFEANQRKDLLECIESAGIEQHPNLFIDEPNAAFLSFLFEHQIDKQVDIDEYDRQYSLVFDFGAGTCDISILEFGKKNNGFYSRNIAISRFEKLGGDDIDKRIAQQVIFSDFCDEFEIDPESISDLEYVDSFEPKFKASAESLKIRVCNKISKLKTKRSKVKDATIFCEEIIAINHKKRQFLMEAQSISFSEFREVMNEFTTSVENSGYSIFLVIESALKKAKMSYADIDNVLLIGGSCKNPLIVEAIEAKFKHSKVLIPEDLQSQVSRGTAINSLLANGLNSPPIAPIVSETISIKLSEDQYFPIINQGEEIPNFKLIAEKLSVQRNGQNSIEMPLYLSGEKRMLQKITITSPTGFNKKDKLKISSEIDKNKIVTIKVFCNEEQLRVEQFSPYSNEVLTPYKRVVKETEREINNLLANGHSAEDSVLREAADSLITIHSGSNNFKEAMEITIKFFPERFQDIAYYASCAGLDKISTEYTFKAYKEEPNSVNAYNLALEYEEDNPEHLKYLKIASELGNVSAKIALADILNEDSQARELMVEAFDTLYSKFQRDARKLSNGDIEDLVSTLEFLNYSKILADVRQYQEAKEKRLKAGNLLYREDNLLKSRQKAVPE